MKVLVLDIVHDLRVKRLWPVAAVLLVALIALPVILLRGSSPAEVSAPEPVAEAPSPLGTSIKLTDKPEGGSSDLGQFDRHNPFRPKLPPEKDPAEAAGATAADASASGGQPSPPPATDASTGGTTPSGGGSEATPPGKSPAGGGGGSSKSSKNSDNSVSTTPAGNDSGKTKHKGSGGNNDTEVRLLSYNAETAYGPAGHVSRHTVEPNEVFPRNGKRYFMYSGVSKDGKEAIFTVLDPSLVAERGGGGSCVQVSGRCAVLHLRDGQERRFENEKGQGFVVRLGALDPVKKLVDDLSGKLRDTVDRLLDPLKQ